MNMNFLFMKNTNIIHLATRCVTERCERESKGVWRRCMSWFTPGYWFSAMFHQKLKGNTWAQWMISSSRRGGDWWAFNSVSSQADCRQCSENTVPCSKLSVPFVCKEGLFGVQPSADISGFAMRGRGGGILCQTTKSKSKNNQHIPYKNRTHGNNSRKLHFPL